MQFLIFKMRVCKEWFPKGTYKGQRDDGFYMDDKLAQQLKICAINVVDDWDFAGIISGGGQVRIGKSMLALQICIYWCWLMNKLHKIKNNG